MLSDFGQVQKEFIGKKKLAIADNYRDSLIK